MQPYIIALLTLVKYVLLFSRASAEPYYVTPTSSIPCPEKNASCLTLSQYALKSDIYFTLNTSLIFLPGTHILDEDLRITNIINLMIASYLFSNVTVSCSNTSTVMLYFDHIEYIHVKELEIDSCRMIAMSIDMFTLTDCKYEGQGHYDSGLLLFFVISANFEKSGFFSNAGTQLKLRATNNGTRILHAGGAIYAYDSSVYITDSLFDGNKAQFGGAVCAWNSIVEIHNSIFTNNEAVVRRTADSDSWFPPSNMSSLFDDDVLSRFFNFAGGMGGAIFFVGRSNATSTIKNSQFIENAAVGSGGAIFISEGKTTEYHITNATFSNNTAINAGALAINSSNPNLICINSTQFIHNKAKEFSGAIGANGTNSVSITNTEFVSNKAILSAGAVGIFYGTNVFISGSKFINNSVVISGGAVAITGGEDYFPVAVIANTLFSHNTAASIGGALVLMDVWAHINNTNFTQNTAAVGGAILALSANINSTGLLNIQKNLAYHYGSFLLINCTLSHEGNFSFSNNNGSLFAIQYSNVSLLGYSHFTHSVPINPTDALLQEGGAVSCLSSKIVFTGSTHIATNKARKGGAILATNCKLYMYNNATLANNTATISGGGIYAYRSELILWGKTRISHNIAMNRGGGMHLLSTTAKFVMGIFIYENNNASKGGGAFIETDAKLYIAKPHYECQIDAKKKCPNLNPDEWLRLEFSSNSADYGGALYISDDTAPGTCAAILEDDRQINSDDCFLQLLSTLPIVQNHGATTSLLHIQNIYFTNNSANQSGAILYGGLLDRCKVSPTAEIKMKYPHQYINGELYLLNVTNIPMDDFKTTKITSDPVRICFCRENHPDCNYHPHPLQVRKGETFKLSLVAVDQVNNTIPNTIIHSSLSLSQGGLKENQSLQQTFNGCTEMTYNAFSPNKAEKLHIYAEGPCKDLGISGKNIDLFFVACPTGFVESATKGCQCDPALYPEYISNCSIDTESVLRRENVWITFINTTHHVGYETYKYCPFGYCIANPVYVNLRNPNIQCTFNRSGKLCGSCEGGLSLTFGDAHCTSCSNSWLTLLILFAIAGIALVAFILVCNFTATVGTINGLTFYANIVAANRAIFFPFQKPNVLTIFIAWLNLDFGFQTCFYDGMDGYAKTWLQLAFPAYTILLVVAVIVISAYSQQFARMISKRNPVATLATLILLSYAKLLRIIIAALSFATLEYSDGSQEVVWLVDGNIPYLKGKHIPLFVTALLIILVGLVYTFLLFSWMWLLRCPNWKFLRWLRNTKLHSFMDAYNAPYNAKHRYWTGLLLLVRALLYLISALNIFGNPSFNLLFISCTVVALILLDKSFDRIYKNRFLNGLESSFMYNLIIFSAATLYLQSNRGSQSALAYTSTVLAFVTFLAILIYHTYAFVFCCVKKHKDRINIQVHSQVTNPLLKKQEHSRYEELHSAFDISEEDPITKDDDDQDLIIDSPQKPHIVTSTEVSIHNYSDNGSSN